MASVKAKKPTKEEEPDTPVIVNSIEQLEFTRPNNRDWVRCPGCTKEIKLATINGQPGFLCGKCRKDPKNAFIINNAPVTCPQCDEKFPKSQLAMFHNVSCQKCFIEQNCVNLLIPASLTCIAQATAKCEQGNIPKEDYLMFSGVCKTCTKEYMKSAATQFKNGELNFDYLTELAEGREAKRLDMIERASNGESLVDPEAEQADDGATTDMDEDNLPPPFNPDETGEEGAETGEGGEGGEEGGETGEEGGETGEEGGEGGDWESAAAGEQGDE